MNLASYLIQVNIYLILFYIFYATVLKRETFFVLNRIYLMGTSIVSLLIPLLKLEWFRDLQATQTVERTARTIIIQAEPIVITPTTQSGLTYSDYLMFIYFAGVAFFTIRFLIALMAVFYGRGAKNHAWSFFNRIVVSEDLPLRDTILLHERVHVKQIHSADRLFSELIAIVCWFNPVAYRLKKAIKHIHEFIADEISARGNKAEYATLLVSEAIGVKPQQLANSFFNESLLKQRIIMLSKTKSKKVAVLKYGLSAPLFVGMLIVSSITLEAKDITTEKNIRHVRNAVAKQVEKIENEFAETGLVSNVSAKEEVKVSISTLTPSDNFLDDEDLNIIEPDMPLDTVIHPQASLDLQPEFPGGIGKFRDFIKKNFIYPKAAAEASLGGRVIVQFIVEKDGSLGKVNVVRDLGFGTGDEAKRVIAASPKWNPGMKGGNPVRVLYTIPFALTPPASASDPSIKIGGGDPTNVVYLVDGKEITYEEVMKIPSGTIESIQVIEDSEKIKEYKLPEGKTGVVIIKMKKK